MKLLTITTAVLLGGVCLPVLAFAATDGNGCELKMAENGGYSFKVDGSCGADTSTGNRETLAVEAEPEPETPDEDGDEGDEGTGDEGGDIGGEDGGDAGDEGGEAEGAAEH